MLYIVIILAWICEFRKQHQIKENRPRKFKLCETLGAEQFSVCYIIVICKLNKKIYKQNTFLKKWLKTSYLIYIININLKDYNFPSKIITFCNQW